MKCEHCPVNPDRPCVVETGADPWFCTMVGHREFADLVLSHSAPKLPPLPDRAGTIVVAAPPQYEPLTRDQLAAVNACPHRVCPVGCQRSTCRLGKGDEYGRVTLEFCRDCLRTA